MKWFKHMAGMDEDPRIKRLTRRYGLEGFGLYNLVLGRIVKRLEANDPIPDLEETARDIADDMNADTVRIEEIMSFCVSEELFSIDDVSGRIVAHKIYKFLDERMTRSGEIKAMIDAYKQVSETVRDSPRQSETIDDRPRLSETVDARVEESRVEETRVDSGPTDTTDPKPTEETIELEAPVKIPAKRLEKLDAEYGAAVVRHYAEKVADYCQTHGKRYKDYAAAVRQYIRRDEERGEFERIASRIRAQARKAPVERCEYCGRPLTDGEPCLCRREVDDDEDFDPRVVYYNAIRGVREEADS